MFKYLFAALTALVLVLWGSGTFTPANATTNTTTNDPQVYIWDYTAIGSNQVVCKQVGFHTVSRPLPKGVDVQPTHISSKVVDEGYCANLTKPKV
ncbi:hypothetical protein [Lyngbya sp. PCC 8106]|uniref:hypothetical protein n=1 Tax=Lyngbya sp. (strain PCC 8106) TaxID=313612 RepID=UPI0000EAC726|nr:hypothetical protein [Lyngbya sp. PCC 8106]EAW38602.1 hypothetical protein L8106_14345 [Lyngbya sp. PCC 8106]